MWIHSTRQVLMLPFPHFTPLLPHVLTEMKALKHFDSVSTLCLAPGRIYKQISSTGMCVWIGTRTWAGISAATCSFLPVFWKAKGSILWEARMRGPFLQTRKAGSWWCLCSLILSKMDGQARGCISDNLQRNLQGMHLIKYPHDQVQSGCCCSPQTLLKGPWAKY